MPILLLSVRVILNNNNNNNNNINTTTTTTITTSTTNNKKERKRKKKKKKDMHYNTVIYICILMDVCIGPQSLNCFQTESNECNEHHNMM